MANAEVCRSQCQHDIQLLLLTIWQLFSCCIAKANWKILNLPQPFIAKVLSTWILKTGAVPKQGQLPYYRLQIFYCDWVFSERITSVWWFKHFISSRWDSLIIMNIIAEGKPTFQDYRKKAAEWFINKKNILYKYFGFKPQIWITDLSEGLWTENS